MSWSIWIPSKEQPWDINRIAHLHRRAGFALSWTTIQTSLRNGFEATVSGILDHSPSPATADFETMAQTIGDAALLFSMQPSSD
jgi:hypothetical protein